MRDFSCFSESGVQIVDSSSSSSLSSSHRASQNLVTCVYESRFHGTSRFITVAWSRSLMGHNVSIGVQTPAEEYLCKVDIKPWIFARRKGFRTTRTSSGSKSSVIDVYWDFSAAKFGSSSCPEPKEGFYIAVTFNRNLVLVLGDLHLQLQKQINKKLAVNPNQKPVVSGSGSKAVLISKREHVFGNKSYTAKAQFHGSGRVHDVLIECEEKVSEPCLVISVDGKAAMRVKQLRWKFRGNQTIVVDGVAVEVYWDVHSWFFGNVLGNAVFLFQTCVSGSGREDEHGFSLVLYAWKNE